MWGEGLRHAVGKQRVVWKEDWKEFGLAGGMGGHGFGRAAGMPPPPPPSLPACLPCPTFPLPPAPTHHTCAHGPHLPPHLETGREEEEGEAVLVSLSCGVCL